MTPSTPRIMLPEEIILIAGTGRSGSTWLGKLFDSSPRVFYKHEPDNVASKPWFRGIPPGHPRAAGCGISRGLQYSSAL